MASRTSITFNLVVSKGQEGFYLFVTKSIGPKSVDEFVMMNGPFDTYKHLQILRTLIDFLNKEPQYIHSYIPAGHSGLNINVKLVNTRLEIPLYTREYQPLKPAYFEEIKHLLKMNGVDV